MGIHTQLDRRLKMNEEVDYEWQKGQVEFWLRKHGFSETNTPY